MSGNLLLRRNDVLSAAGLNTAPQTWDELAQQAEKVNKPPLFGLGLALSNVGDGNTQISVLQSFGGRIADDAGKTAAIKSDATKAYLTWVKNAWDKGLFPPGNTTWDGAGDNQAYLAGQAVFIANTGSVGIAAKKQDPELFKATLYSSLPGGPKGVISPIQPQLRVIPKSSQNQDTAKALLEFLAQPDFMKAYYAEAIYGPVLQGPGEVRRLRRLERDSLRPARSGEEGHAAGLSRRLQRRLCRHVHQLHRAEDGPAGRDRQLGLRQGDGRGPDADPGDLRQVQVLIPGPVAPRAGATLARGAAVRQRARESFQHGRCPAG